jgi:hypothetical protein
MLFGVLWSFKDLYRPVRIVIAKVIVSGCSFVYRALRESMRTTDLLAPSKRIAVPQFFHFIQSLFQSHQVTR